MAFLYQRRNQKGEAKLSAAEAETPKKAKLASADLVVLVAAIAATAILGAAGGLTNFFVMPLMQEFDATRGAVLFFFAFGPVGVTVLAPFVGRLLTFIPPWIIMTVGVFGTSATLIMASMGSSMPMASIGIVAMHAISWVLCGSLVCQTIVVSRVPQILGLVIGAQSMTTAALGVVIPLLIAPFLTDHGWRATLLATAVIVLILALPLILLFLRGEGNRTPKIKPVAVGEVSASPVEAPVKEIAPTTGQILRTPTFWILLLALEPMAMIGLALTPNLIPFYADRGVGLEQVSYLLSAIGALAIVGAMASGIIVDRLGSATYFMINGAISAGALIALTFNLGPPAIWFCVLFLGVSGMGPTLGVAVKAAFGAAGYAPTMGLFAPFMLTSAFAGAGAGWVRDHFGSYQLVFAFLAIAMIVSASAGAMLFFRIRNASTAEQADAKPVTA